jgi:hypothetical protein
MVSKIYYLNEASITGICILLVLKLLFPEIIVGTWFVSAVIFKKNQILQYSGTRFVQSITDND